MKKFSFAYVKENPVMFGAIVVVFGLLFYLLINRGSSAGGSTQYVSSGPSEGLQAASLSAGAAIQAKQIDAGIAANANAIQLEALTRQIDGAQNMAVLEMQQQARELAVTENLGSRQIDASLIALQSQLNSNLAVTESNNDFMVNYARVAADSAVTQLAIGAALQRDLSAQQLEGYKYGLDTSVKQAALSIIPTLKKKNRDDALIALTPKLLAPPSGLVTYQ